MEPKPSKYAPKSPGDVLDLVQGAPLAWIVSQGEPSGATALPLRPVLDDSGQLIGFKGHFARNNPQVQTLQTQNRALILFMGPQGYVSPSWMADRTQAPTWNYAGATFDCRIEFFDEPAQIEALLVDLISDMEKDRPQSWTLAEMGARAQGLSRGIIGFDATILDRQVAFKLGQDERDDVYSDILKGLETTGNYPLIALMRHHNPGR